MDVTSFLHGSQALCFVAMLLVLIVLLCLLAMKKAAPLSHHTRNLRRRSLKDLLGRPSHWPLPQTWVFAAHYAALWRTGRDCEESVPSLLAAIAPLHPFRLPLPRTHGHLAQAEESVRPTTLLRPSLLAPETLQNGVCVSI